MSFKYDDVVTCQILDLRRTHPARESIRYCYYKGKYIVRFQSILSYKLLVH